MNEYLAQNSSFSYAPKRGTLLFIDRGQDMVTPLMHESTFQAMAYDLLEVKDDQISYEAETNSGTTTKTAFLNENDKQWVEFRHTHIAKVSTEIGKRMAALSASNADTSLGRGKSTDLQAMAAGLHTMKEAERSKVMQSAALSKKHETVLQNMVLVAGADLYKQNGNSLLSSEELKLSTKKAEAVEYSNARYDPKIKAIVSSALKRTLDETEYPYIITPPPQSPTADDSKKGPVSLRKKNSAKGKTQEPTQESEQFTGEKMIVFVSGGATYSELRSIYEVRSEEKRDVILGTTALMAPPTFIESLATLKETNPTPSTSGQGAEVMPLTSGEIHLQVEAQQMKNPTPTQ
eukprot:jgi/Phyca11/15783/fgenesh1_pg.PHYCAscaffold_15_\